MNDLFSNMRYSFRGLVKRPVFSVSVALVLGLGIGANTTVFSLINALLLQPLPGTSEPERLVTISRTQEGTGFDSLSHPDFLDFRDALGSQIRALESIAVYSGRGYIVAVDGEHERLIVDAVSGEYFSTLGTNSSLGRVLGPNDEAQATQAVVLSHRLWKRRFGGDEKVVGQSLAVEGHTFQIVGVMPKGFRGADAMRQTDLWVPLPAFSLLRPQWQLLGNRGSVWLDGFGRLAPGGTVAAADAEMKRMADNLVVAFPDSNDGRGIVVTSGLGLHPGARESVTNAVTLLMAVAAFVLLVAVANVANLLLVRLRDRRRELGIRLAVGASRARIAGLLLSEAIWLSLVGGAVGVLLTFWTVDLMRLLVSVSGLAPDASILSFSPDFRLLVFAASVSSLTACLVAVAPALMPVPELASLIKSASARRSRGLLRGSLVVVQQALALLLLIGAGLLVRSWHNMTEISPGFNAENVVVAGLRTSADAEERSVSQGFYTQVLDAVRALPNVEHASLTSLLPLSRSRWDTVIRIDGEPIPEGREGLSNAFRIVTPDSFKTLGMDLLTGRDFHRGDTSESPRVAVINESMARRYWGEQNPVGQSFEINMTGDFERIEVIGLVRDSKYRSLTEEPYPHMYLPLAQSFTEGMTLQVRTAGNPVALMTDLRTVIRRIDPDKPVLGLRLLEEQVTAASAQSRVMAELIGIFALVACFLAAVGLYATLAYDVRQRHHEMGVRLAMGARAVDVVGMVVQRGLRLVAVGTVLGVGVALGATRVLESQLYGVAATDPRTFFVLVLGLVAVGLMATWLPARRASRLDPTVVLRYE